MKENSRNPGGNFMKTPNLQSFYEDEHILVCYKPSGFATQSRKIGICDIVSLIKNHIAASANISGDPYLAVIHRLDQPVSGILVFAKTPFAAAGLNKQLQHHGFGKYYRALVSGALPAEEGTLENFLVKNTRTNTSKICTKNTPGAKFARLHYKVVKKGQGFFNWGRSISDFTTSPIEVDIQLDTGRHHQIRVQLAAAGAPIIGDTKYGVSAPWNAEQKKGQGICLCAYRLDFHHPKTNIPMHFEISKIPETS